MISSLRGTVEALGPNFALVSLGPITIKIHLPTSAQEGAVVGETVQLYTHLYMREDLLALYGFSSPQELALFEKLLSVRGVGPKVALALLSVQGGGQAQVLAQIPGIGNKTAQRLILELKGRLAAAPDSELEAALSALGYSPSEAAHAASSLAPNLPLEEKVRRALQTLDSR